MRHIVCQANNSRMSVCAVCARKLVCVCFTSGISGFPRLGRLIRPDSPYNSLAAYLRALSSVYHLSCPQLILVVPARNCHVFTMTNTRNHNPRGLGPTSLHGPYPSYTITELLLTLLLLRFSWNAFPALANPICPPKIWGPRDTPILPPCP